MNQVSTDLFGDDDLAVLMKEAKKDDDKKKQDDNDDDDDDDKNNGGGNKDKGIVKDDRKGYKEGGDAPNGSHIIEKVAKRGAITLLGGKLRSYIRDMEERSGLKVTQNQRELLAKELRKKKPVKLEGLEKTRHTGKFTKAKRESLIGEWEENTGQKWPKYPKDMKKDDGSLHPSAGKPHQAHHVIPQENGGPHEWWNMHPLTGGKNHQGGVHGAGSLLRIMQKEVK